MSRGTVLIETHVARSRRLLRGRRSVLARLLMLERLFANTPIWRQYREYELHPEDRSNWFGPNIQAVIEAFESGGFATTHLKSWGERAAFRAELRPELLARLAEGSYEGLADHGLDLLGLQHAPRGIYRPETPQDPSGPPRTHG